MSRLMFGRMATLDFYHTRYIIKDMNGKQAIKRLEAQGFALVRVAGSHHLLSRGSLRVTVPVHGAADLKTGTLKSIEKQSGVKLT